MSQQQLSLSELNAMEHDQFVSSLGFVFEGPPWIVQRAAAQRPFDTVEVLFQALCDVLYAASEAEKTALIQAHPDLAGKAVIAGGLTEESTREQASAGLNHLSPTEYERFMQLNTQYRELFGFPFVICVREHTKASILAQFVARLQHSRASEIETALGEITKIARLRLDDAFPESSSEAT